MKVKSRAFRGVLSALVTPMKTSGDVDYPTLAVFADHLVRCGVHGLIPLGSTGEYYALEPSERQRVLQTVLDAVAGRVPVIAGTNAGSTRDVVAYSRQAEKLGAVGVMLAPPYYSLPTPDELFAHFRAVNDVIGIPMMLYNYPGRTGIDMRPEFIARLTSLKNVRYVKESTGEMPRITTLLRLCGDRMGIFCGCDTIALESLLVGAVGWVGGVVNVLPKAHVRLYDLVMQGRLADARRLFESMLPMLELMENGSKYTQWVKAACGLLGRDCGPPRRPLARATNTECARLRKALSEVADGRDRQSTGSSTRRSCRN